MASSIDPDEMAHDELSHQDLHCLHRYLGLPSEWPQIKTVKDVPQRKIIFLIFYGIYI